MIRENLKVKISPSLFLSNKIVHREPYHGPRKFAWEYLKKGDEKNFSKFEEKYFKSLNNRAVPQRTRYAITK